MTALRRTSDEKGLGLICESANALPAHLQSSVTVTRRLVKCQVSLELCVCGYLPHLHASVATPDTDQETGKRPVAGTRRSHTGHAATCTTTLSQRHYAEEMLRTYDAWDCFPSPTFLPPGQRLNLSQGHRGRYTGSRFPPPPIL